MTWGALFGRARTSATHGSIAVSALGVAVTQLGVMEHPRGFKRGSVVDQYLRSTGTPLGSFWCMAFIFWCFREATAAAGVSNPFPRTAGCIDAWNRVKRAQPQRLIARAQAMATPSLVRPGQVFVLDYGRGKGHAGFVCQGFDGPFPTIEGNSNPSGSRNGLGVYELNRRKIMDRSLRGFINFT